MYCLMLWMTTMPIGLMIILAIGGISYVGADKGLKNLSYFQPDPGELMCTSRKHKNVMDVIMILTEIAVIIYIGVGIKYYYSMGCVL